MFIFCESVILLRSSELPSALFASLFLIGDLSFSSVCFFVSSLSLLSSFCAYLSSFSWSTCIWAIVYSACPSCCLSYWFYKANMFVCSWAASHFFSAYILATSITCICSFILCTSYSSSSLNCCCCCRWWSSSIYCCYMIYSLCCCMLLSLGMLYCFSAWWAGSVA